MENKEKKKDGRPIQVKEGKGTGVYRWQTSESSPRLVAQGVMAICSEKPVAFQGRKPAI